MKKLAIIVLNYNGGRQILSCLRSLQGAKSLAGWQVKILVVDNGSTDGSVESIKQLTDYELRVKDKENNSQSVTRNRLIVKLIENKKNLGFAGGMNVGIRYALKNGAEAVMLLNQDTEVKKDFLEPLLANPADIVGPVIKFRRENNLVYDFGGKVDWWTGRTEHVEIKKNNSFGMEKLKIKNYNVKLRGNNVALRNAKFKIDYVSGCAMLIKRSVLEKIGLLDERYFLYFEDADFCLRAKKAGFKIAVEPKSVILHHLTPTKKKPLWQNWQLLKSNLIFINHWILWWRRPITYFYWGALAIKMLLR